MERNTGSGTYLLYTIAIDGRLYSATLAYIRTAAELNVSGYGTIDFPT